MPDEEPVEEPSPTRVRMLVDALGEAPGEASVTGPVVDDDAASGAAAVVALCTAPVVVLMRLPTMIGDAEVDVQPHANSVRQWTG